MEDRTFGTDPVDIVDASGPPAQPLDAVTDGNPPPRRPTAFVSNLSAGAFHNCGLMTDGTVRCWGRSDAGHGPMPKGGVLGGSSIHTPVLRDNTVDVLKAKAVISGDRHNCAVLDVPLTPSDHHIYCWGYNDVGQLNAPRIIQDPAGPDQLSADPSRGLEQIVAGATHSCASAFLTSPNADQSVIGCWGAGGAGQIPPTPSTPRASGFAIYEGIAANAKSSCVLAREYAAATATGTWCTGRSNAETVGGPQYAYQVGSPGAVGFRKLFGGFDRMCALADKTVGSQTTVGVLYCWSPPAVGGTAQATEEPGVSGVTEVALGRAHACGLFEGGVVRCWGHNEKGQTGAKDAVHSDPRVVEGISEAVHVVVGDSHSCAQSSDGTVRCWGDDTYGQLGESSLSAPVPF